MALALVLLLCWYAAVALGVTVGYHRVLCHRAARLARPVAWALVWAGLPAGPPAQWVANHRRHHALADRPGDPHCPERDGFWYAQAGWYLGIRSTPLIVAYALLGPLRLLLDLAGRPTAPKAPGARDIARDPFFGFLSTRLGYGVCALPHLAPVALGAALHGWTGLAVTWVLAAVMYNVGDLVNSALHLWGKQDFRVRDGSRNAGWLALLTFGECFHNGHHAFPWSARHGLLPGQLDLSYAFLRALRALGWASRLRVPSERALAKKRLR